MLKRKNEDFENNTVKRVALDSEAVEQKDIEDDKQKTSVSFNPDDRMKEENDDEAALANAPEGDNAADGTSGSTDHNNNNHNHTSTSDRKSGPISSHKVPQNDDPTYVHFRMLCTIAETATIVGKGGETITKIKELSNARVNVSENLKGVPERVISVRGPSECVAKAFGLITRMILDEPLDTASSLQSKQYNLRLLFPHTIMGYIIGKKGAKFREIEENSAASLKANDQILPASTDRVLNINGVADAIHIAAYYIAQTVIEHKQHMTKAIYYNPANYSQATQPNQNRQSMSMMPGGGMNMGMNMNGGNNNNNMNHGGGNQFPPQAQNFAAMMANNLRCQ
ncbi:unnamed protein product [Ambrosiozyma monospora]|uniref:Unnamed protein product n=1 Tax=Ambrosiozyma monospora TaxID=43982 RepID=A0ACB5T8F2_AMBMO|nr:unnamed protein product [Ambrosiozyma monospora]